MNSLRPERVLILAPHTDDGEFGCGGTIAKLVEEGAEVFCAAFSACEQSVPKEFPRDILVSEVKAAVKTLGVKLQNLVLFDYQVRTFNFRRQEILDDMIKLRRDISPDMIFMPSLQDIHQDHRAIAEEGLRAFKFGSIFCYEIPWNNLTLRTSAFVHLQKRHLNRKISALRQYKSQAHRPYASAEFIVSLARTRGVQSGTTFAETFDVIRWISK